MKKVALLVLSALLYGLLSMMIGHAYAKDRELVIVYTGETHAALYPCHCPVEPDGGVARRASLIKEIRKQHPDLLLLDSGSFFSGGLLDQNSQNTESDKSRAVINLNAMELMHYDAIALSDDEFNFGTDFFIDSISKTKLKFVSSNLKLNKVAPYILKDSAGLKVGIFALTNPQVKQKAQGLELAGLKQVVKETVAQIKKDGAKIVILLSNLGEEEDLKVIEGVSGVDVVIDGRGKSTKEAFTKKGNIIFLRPGWQGRRLGKALLTLKNDVIEKVAAEGIRVSDRLSDDKQVLSILPRCFSDNECKKEGLVGICQKPGDRKSSCIFSEALKVNLTVITSKECLTCSTEAVVNSLKKELPGLKAAYFYYPDKRANSLMGDLKLNGLPVYLLDKEVIKDKGFDNLKNNFEEKGDYFMLKPEASGISYFIDRKKIPGRLDIFLSLFDRNSYGLLNVIKGFSPQLHFLAIVREDKTDAPFGLQEVEEDLRSVCVSKYYPEKFWDYISCRAKDINSTWWEDCAAGIDIQKIKTCARGDEGKGLLQNNSQLNNELKISRGPTYLLDNRQIFSSKGVPSKEELEKIIRGEK